MYIVFVHAYLIGIHGKTIISNVLMKYMYINCSFVNSGESITSCRIVIYVTLIDNNIFYIIQEGKKEQPKVTPQPASTRSPKVSIVIKKNTTLFFQNSVKEE